MGRTTRDAISPTEKPPIKASTLILIILIVALGANFITVALNMLSSSTFLIPESSDIMSEASPQKQMLLLIIFTGSFLVPTIIIFFYIAPVYRGLKRPETKNEPLPRRRALNGPLVIGLLGLVGWLIGPLSNFVHDFSGGRTLILIRILLNSLLAGTACFVIVYYTLEYFFKKKLILWFFAETSIREANDVIRLSIRMRFLILFVAISVFPLIFMFNIILGLINKSGEENLLASLTIALLIFLGLGIFLAFFLAQAFQRPLTDMEKATRRIENDDFAIDLPVLSNDEIGTLSDAFNSMAGELREKEFINDTFGKMVDPNVRDYLLAGNIDLGGKSDLAAILFSDIRSFTTMAEQFTPAQTVHLLNRYFEKMNNVITGEKGLINKYIGDAILAVFGIPLPNTNSPDLALNAAISMHRELASLNQSLKSEKLPEIRIGTGLHYGEVLAGNIGSSSRMEYTVIGDAVNIASRIENSTKYYGSRILASQQVIDNLQNADNFSFREVDLVCLKGKSEAVGLFEVLDACPDSDKKAREESRDCFSRALLSFREGKFGKARNTFRQCLEQNPQDQISQLYVQRCEDLIASPPDEPWAPVTRLGQKF